MAPFWFLLYSQSLTSDKLPSGQEPLRIRCQDRTNHAQRDCKPWLFVCKAEKVPATFPSPTLFSNKVHSVVWGGFEKPGHPAGRPNPTRGDPVLLLTTDVVCSPQLTQPCPGTCVCVYTHAHAHPLGPPVSSLSLSQPQTEAGWIRLGRSTEALTGLVADRNRY